MSEKQGNETPVPTAWRETAVQEFAAVLRDQGYEDAAAEVLATGDAGDGGWRRDPAVKAAIKVRLDAAKEELARVNVTVAEAARARDESADKVAASEAALRVSEEEEKRLREQIEELQRERARLNAHLTVLAAAGALEEAVTEEVNLLGAKLAAIIGDKSAHREKRDVAEYLSHLIRRWGLYIEHPDHGRPCNLLCVYDLWGGKFVLAERKTDKRSRTTRDLKTLLPFKLMWPND